MGCEGDLQTLGDMLEASRKAGALPTRGKEPRRVDETPRMRRWGLRNLFVRLPVPLLRLEVERVAQHTQARDL